MTNVHSNEVLLLGFAWLFMGVVGTYLVQSFWQTAIKATDTASKRSNSVNTQASNELVKGVATLFIGALKVFRIISVIGAGAVICIYLLGFAGINVLKW